MRLRIWMLSGVLASLVGLPGVVVPVELARALDARALGVVGQVVLRADDLEHAYELNTDQDFANCYDPTWGRHKARTIPTVGGHEYLSPNAAPYFSYFGSAAGDPAKGYYSYELGNWHVVSLNTYCSAVGGCQGQLF